MKVDLSPEEAQNLIAFINAYPAKGQEQEVATMLKLKLTKAIQEEVSPSRDGARTEGIPAKS